MNDDNYISLEEEFFDSGKDVKDFDNVEWDTILHELKIDDSSPATLQRDLVNYTIVKSKYTKWRAKAIKEVDKLSMKLDLISSLIMKEFLDQAERDGKSIAVSGLSEIRKIRIPLDPRWRKTKKKLIEAVERSNLLEGIVFDWVSKGKRLEEVGELMKIYMRVDPTVYTAHKKFTSNKAIDATMEKLEYE